MLEYIILGFLHHGAMSGYNIKQCMKHSTVYFFDASFGSIYPMLKKMEQSGRIASHEDIENGKYRKVYEITGDGRDTFSRWLAEPMALSRSRHDHLVRIFFYGSLPTERARALIGGFMGLLEAELAALDDLERKISSHAGFFEAATLDYGKAYYRFTLDWCRSFLQRMDQAGQGDSEKEDKPCEYSY